MILLVSFLRNLPQGYVLSLLLPFRTWYNLTMARGIARIPRLCEDEKLSGGQEMKKMAIIIIVVFLMLSLSTGLEKADTFSNQNTTLTVVTGSDSSTDHQTSENVMSSLANQLEITNQNYREPLSIKIESILRILGNEPRSVKPVHPRTAQIHYWSIL